MRMKIDHLNYKVEYIKGSENFEADALSRAPRSYATADDTFEEEHPYRVSMLTEELLESAPTSQSGESKLARLQANDDRISTEEQVREKNSWSKTILDNADETYSCVNLVVKEKWPDSPENIPAKLLPYWKVKEQLGLDDEGLLVKDSKLVIPPKVRPEIIHRIVSAHMGDAKSTWRVARSTWWPGQNEEIKKALKECQTCQETRPSKPKVIEAMHDVPLFPFDYCMLT